MERKRQVDQVYVKKHVYFIGTVIKKKVTDLHTKINDGKKLTIRQRKIMTNSLSSKLPPFMYGPPPIYNNPALNIPIAPTTAADIHGYRYLKNGGYYNIFTKKKLQ